MDTFKKYLLLSEQTPSAPPAGGPAGGAAPPSAPAGGPAGGPGSDLGGLGGLGGGLGGPIGGGIGGGGGMPPSLSGGGGLGGPDPSMAPQSNIKIQKINSKNVWDVLDKLLSNTDGQQIDKDYNKISDL